MRKGTKTIAKAGAGKLPAGNDRQKGDVLVQRRELNILEKIQEQVAELARELERIQIADYVDLLNRPRKLIVSNVIAGIARGVGFAIGFTIFTTTIFYLLKKLGALDLPIVGDYIAELVKIVQVQLEGKRF